MNSLDLPRAEAATPEQQFQQDVVVILEAAQQHRQNGEFSDAETLYQTILEAVPGQPDTSFHLGTLYIETRNPSKALPHFEACIGAMPQNSHYWFAYINALIEDKQDKAAWIAFEIGQKHGLSGPMAEHLIQRMTGAPVLTLARAAQPASAPVTESKPNKAGMKGVRRPSSQDINRFTQAFNKGAFKDAVKIAQTLTQRYALDGASWRCLGVALNRDGRHADSVAPLRKSVELIPDDIQTRVLLADTLVVLQQHAAAEVECRSIIEARADVAEAHRLLGIALAGTGKFEEAAASCRRAIELAPTSPATHGTLGMLMLEAGRMTEAAECLRNAVDLNADDVASHSNLLFSLVHRIDIDQKSLYMEHLKFAERHEASIERVPLNPNIDRSTDRTLRIGFVSGDLFNHAVTSYVLPVLKSLANDPSLQIVVYQNHTVEDAHTQRLQSCASQWRRVARLSDDRLASTIQADGIDILVDLSGHTGRNRLLTFVRKPAPVQATWIGYPATTGLAAMDYYFADRFCAPFELASEQFREALVHLPAIAPFIAPENCPPVNILPALHNGYVTFGSFNRINKVRPEVIALWAKILHAMPSSKMLIGAIRREGDRSDEAHYADQFAKQGISRDRLMFVPRSATAVYLQQHHQVDLCLDAFPFSASTTTLNALWMGVPTLTMAGNSLVSRGATTWLSHVGLESFVTKDKDDFVQSALSIVSDLPALNELRLGLRERCIQSAAFQPDVVAQGVARAFRTMWQRWCEGQPVSHIDVSTAPGA
ncbi:TPR domain-containing protein [Caballeronia cordobensis]|uniref:protein O-GlcNAc transferase n=1 Tax=Caballeronia cordobensis TaxID=1353886 RepID=A0A158F1S0_CABCO|nr:tetratricopeptide repeat protein [Caballeronia cordobensis]SAL12950.1 TPR domain-containing protein [Caballeronia cordobensis]